jgi:hypothetical protein
METRRGLAVVHPLLVVLARVARVVLYADGLLTRESSRAPRGVGVIEKSGAAEKRRITAFPP